MSGRHAVPLALLGLAACAEARTPLVVYSPHGRDLLTLMERAYAAEHPDIKVRWVPAGPQDLLDRVRSEGARPRADVWFGGPASLFQRAADDSLLDPYRPSWADAIPARGRGAEDLYFAVYETPVVIAYHAKAVPAAEAPGDWDDVLDPRWRGRVVIPHPAASGAVRAVFGMIIQRGLRDVGDTAAGFGWLRRLDAQTRDYPRDASLAYQQVLRAEGVITVGELPDILQEQRRGSPLGYVLPRSGTPVIADAIAVVRGARHPEARRFVDWVGTLEAQLLGARQAFRLPARTDIPVDSLPDWAREVRAQLRVAEVDWAMLQARGAEWMTYWDGAVRGGSR